MKSLNELKDAVETGLRVLETQAGIKEAEVFASSNSLRVLRVCYASNVPCNALEEPKSEENFGISVRVVFDSGHIGFGKADNELGKDAVMDAFTKAKMSKVMDKDFVSLPKPGEKPKIKNYHDNEIMQAQDEKEIDLAYASLNGALDNLESKKLERNLNITGELNFLGERVAIANSNGINEYDESTAALAKITTILEMEKDVSGYWFDSCTHLKKLDAYNTGKVAVEKANALVNAGYVDSGSYDVVMGRQVFADLLYNRFSVSLGAIDQKASQYIGRLDEKIAPEFLNICDNGLYKEAIGTKRVTDEGLATGKTETVKNGQLINFLTNDYYKKKYSKDERFVARNGFRFGGGGRHYDTTPGISATNLVVEAGEHQEGELVKEIKDGLYIGRIWYSYPVNGLTSGDFTSTIRGDTYIVKNGEIVSALVPNTLRINDNFDRCLKNIIGISREKKATLAWGEESVVITPEVAVKSLRLDRIARGLY